MKRTLLLKEEAIEDMTEAFNWYEQKQTGLGLEFFDEVERYFDLITKNPQQYQLYRKQRVVVMHRFPYKIVYEIENETVVVYAVYHDKRNPEKITERE